MKKNERNLSVFTIFCFKLTMFIEMNLTYFCFGYPESVKVAPYAISRRGKNTDLF